MERSASGRKGRFNFILEEYSELSLLAELPIVDDWIRTHAKVVLMANEGLSLKQIKEQGGLAPYAEATWIKRKENRIPGTSMMDVLRTAPGFGRKRVITDEDREWVKQFAAESEDKRSFPLAAKIREVCVEAGHPNLSTIVSSTLLKILKS